MKTRRLNISYGIGTSSYDDLKSCMYHLFRKLAIPVFYNDKLDHYYLVGLNIDQDLAYIETVNIDRKHRTYQALTIPFQDLVLQYHDLSVIKKLKVS